MNTRFVGLSVTLSLVLLSVLGFMVLSWALFPALSMVAAQGPDGHSIYHVALDCSGIALPCYTTVQGAVDAVDDARDVVQVAQGTYTGVQAMATYTQMVYLTKTLTIRGGYHLLPTTDAIDRGLDARVGFDIDNGHRPSLAGYDLGADELSFFL